MTQVFGGSDAIRTMIFPVRTTSIRPWSFYKVQSLRSVVLSEGIEALGNTTREYCDIFRDTGLKRVKLSSKIKVIGNDVFAGCTNLENVKLPEGLEHIGIGCFSGTNLEEFEAPASLRVIEGSAFSECRNLKRVALNDGLQVIGSKCAYDYGVFQKCPIEEIALPVTL